MSDRKEKQKQANTELKFAQIEGKVPTVKTNMSEVEIPENEAHLFHVTVVKEMHDPVKKKYNKHTKTITLTQKDMTQMETHGGQGWAEWDEHTILHNPTKPMETEEEKEAREKAELKAKALKDAKAEYKAVTSKKHGNGWDLATIKEKQAEWVAANPPTQA